MPTTPRIELIPAAPEQQHILANLLELYAHDFSEFRELNLGEDGRFGYSPLPLYWSEPGRYPFLVRVDGKLAGLVLVRRGSQVSGDDSVWDMTEFFIVRGQRKRGVGTAVAKEVWRRFPGTWEVRVLDANVAARKFWAAAIAGFTNEAPRSTPIEKGGASWTLFSFESASAASG